MPSRISPTQAVAGILLAFTAFGLAGCNTKATPVTKEEQVNWKGGPMPADFHPNVAGGPSPPGGGTPAASPPPTTATAPK